MWKLDFIQLNFQELKINQFLVLKIGHFQLILMIFYKNVRYSPEIWKSCTL